MKMLVILLLGAFAIAATGLGMFLARQPRSPGRERGSAAASQLTPKQREMADLFAARLRSGAIGIPDLIRLFKKEGRDAREVSEALLAAMARFPKFARRKDKFQDWIEESRRNV